MPKSLRESILSAPEAKKEYQHQRFVMEVAELLNRHLREKGISRAELAKSLGTTRGYVSQILRGDKNLTLRTVSDICFLLGRRPILSDTVAGDVLVVRDGSSHSFAKYSGEKWGSALSTPKVPYNLVA